MFIFSAGSVSQRKKIQEVSSRYTYNYHDRYEKRISSFRMSVKQVVVGTLFGRELGEQPQKGSSSTLSVHEIIELRRPASNKRN